MRRGFLNPESERPQGTIHMAEQQQSYEFVEVKAADILRDRQEEWNRFTRFTTWSIGLIVLLLAGMAFFLV